ncbi:MAG TPA: methyltransferase [Galbitalea sp.]|jgi:methylase of polypeptide subunit release factors|nr:methyltransferase [Galbitalea sp.]
MDARPELVARLRDDLAAANFTVARLDELWGQDAASALGRGHRVPAVRALDLLVEFDPAAVLARLFVLGMPASIADVAMAVPGLELEGAVELGLLRLGDETVEPLLDLRPYSFTDSSGAAEWWIASDLGELALGVALPEDHVLGVGGASLTLAGLQVERSRELALDLGTGCGIQALHASRHSGRVIATDISQQALDYASFNAQLNGIRNVEFRLGSMFEPVVGERFDYIVTNPPFVITPRAHGVPAYEYRDGGRVGDAIVAEVVAGAAQHLRPGGIAQLLGNWEYHGTEDGLERVGGWIDAADLDGWVIEREVQDAALYAQTWIRDGGTRAGTESDRLEATWLGDFEARGVTAVGFGYVVLRSRLEHAGERFRRIERVNGPVGVGLGARISATLDAHDWQASRDDNEFAREMLVVAPDVTEERHYWPGDEHPAVMNLRQGGGFARTYPLGTALAAVVGACDGELSVAAICAAVSELLEVEESELRGEVLPSLREFVTVGLLT